MKYFYIPCSILVLILSLSLLNARLMERSTDEWCDMLTQAQEAAAQDDWTKAGQILSDIHNAWDEKQSYFHIVSVHAELDEAEALLAKSLSFALDQDDAEFRANTAELITQLRLLSEIQEVSIKNIL